jgi:hypothetical protein
MTALVRHERVVKTESMTADEPDQATWLFRTNDPSWLAAMPPDTVFRRVDLRDFKRVNDDHGFAAASSRCRSW